MSEDEKHLEGEEDIDTLSHEAEGSMLEGWPAFLMTIVMISAALYAFSPRPYPPSPPTKIEANQLLTTGIARQGDRFVAVGELGKILIADSASGPWKEVTVENNYGSNFTDVKYIARDTLLAVGHSGWIIRSDDNGETWQEIQFNKDSADPLLGISGPFSASAKGKIYVFGAFGQILVSTDGGKSFSPDSLNVVEDEPETVAEEESGSDDGESADGGSADGETGGDEMTAEVEEDPFADPFGGGDDDYDPFAEFASGGMGLQDYGTLHIYDIKQMRNGDLLLAGERGMLLKSTDGGASWEPREDIYTGSFYGIQPIGKRGALVYGMRGNAFYSRDGGDTWEQSEIPVVQGLYGGVVSDAGTLVLVGASNTVLVSKDKGVTFTKAGPRGPYGLVEIIPLDSGSYLTAGEGGIAVKNVLRYLTSDAGTDTDDQALAEDWS